MEVFQSQDHTVYPEAGVKHKYYGVCYAIIWYTNRPVKITQYYYVTMLYYMYVGAATSDYRYGTGAIHFGRFYCSGNEPNLTSCSYSVAPSYCTHNHDVGVICRGTIIIWNLVCAKIIFQFSVYLQ